jgi:hypothetical protein
VFTSVARTGLLGIGALVGFGVMAFGLAGLGLSLTDPKYSNDTPVGVGIISLGNALLGSCLVLILRPQTTFMPPATSTERARGFGGIAMSLGAFGMSLPALGILGWIVVFLIGLNTVLALGHPRAGSNYVIPWGTLIVVGIRALQKNWAAVIVIGGVWLAAVIILQVAGYFA